jgi:hypothetical protein
MGGLWVSDRCPVGNPLVAGGCPPVELWVVRVGRTLTWSRPSVIVVGVVSMHGSDRPLRSMSPSLLKVGNDDVVHGGHLVVEEPLGTVVYLIAFVSTATSRILLPACDRSASSPTCMTRAASSRNPMSTIR